MKPTEEEIKKNREAAALKRKEYEIEEKFMYIKKVPDKMIAHSLLLGQAKYVCDLLFELKFSPFKGLYAMLREKFTTSESQYRFMIRENEYGEFEPDKEHIDLFIPKPLKEEPQITHKLWGQS